MSLSFESHTPLASLSATPTGPGGDSVGVLYDTCRYLTHANSSSVPLRVLERCLGMPLTSPQPLMATPLASPYYTHRSDLGAFMLAIMALGFVYSALISLQRKRAAKLCDLPFYLGETVRCVRLAHRSLAAGPLYAAARFTPTPPPTYSSRPREQPCATCSHATGQAIVHGSYGREAIPLRPILADLEPSSPSKLQTREGPLLNKKP